MIYIYFELNSHGWLESADRQKLRQEKRAQNKAMKEAEKQAEQPIVDRIRAIWLRFGNALMRANMEDEDFRKITGKKIYQLDSTQITALEAGEYAPKIKAGSVLPLWNSFYLHEFEDIVKAADALDCSLDYLFLRTNVPEINPGAAKVPEQDTPAAWRTGEPPKAGLYYCRLRWTKPTVLKWNPERKVFSYPASGGELPGELPDWYPLPEVD